MKRKELLNVSTSILSGLLTNKENAMCGEKVLADIAVDTAIYLIEKTNKTIERSKAMNKSRRVEIKRIISELEDLKSRIEDVKSEEEDAYDNLPDSIRDSDRGETMQSAIDSMDDALTSIDDVIQSMEDSIE